MSEDLNFSLKKEIEVRAANLDKNFFIKIDNSNYTFIKSIVIGNEDFESKFKIDSPSWIQLVNKDTQEPLSREDLIKGEEVAIAFSEEQLKVLAVKDYISLIVHDPPYSRHFMRVASGWYALATRNACKSERDIWIDFYRTASDYLKTCISKIESLSDAEWESLTNDMY